MDTLAITVINVNILGINIVKYNKIKVSLMIVVLYFCAICNAGAIKPLAEDFKVIYKTQNPQNTYIYEPGIAVCPNGRIVATFKLGGDGAIGVEGVRKNGRGLIYVSDDGGESWQYQQNFTHASAAHPFVAGSKLYIIGHNHDIQISVSENWGQSWSKPAYLTEQQDWHGSATNIWVKGDYVYKVMERRTGGHRTRQGAASTPTMMQSGWPVCELAPVLLRGNIKKDLTNRENWTFSSQMSFVNIVNDKELDWFGVPFQDNFYPNVESDLTRCSFSPIGWLESNVVQIIDPKHYWYDKTGSTFHIFLRSHTGLSNFACVIKAVEQTDGSIKTTLQRTPSGKKHFYVPFPGGQMKFSIAYDEKSKFYWLVGTQSTDSMTRPEMLDSDRYCLADNERRRLVLHFSKNMIDWCFAGVVSIGPAEYASRHYPNMVINNDDLLIISRSGDLEAKNAHNGNILTLHRVKNFRELVY